MSSLLVCVSIATSVLSFTTNCSQVVQTAGNSTQVINEIGSINRGVSISLVAFSIASALFERHINKKLVDAEVEVEDLKSQNNDLRSRTSGERNSTEHNEPFDVCVETKRSQDTVYPPAVSFHTYGLQDVNRYRQ